VLPVSFFSKAAITGWIDVSLRHVYKVRVFGWSVVGVLSAPAVVRVPASAPPQAVSSRRTVGSTSRARRLLRRWSTAG